MKQDRKSDSHFGKDYLRATAATLSLFVIFYPIFYFLDFLFEPAVDLIGISVFVILYAPYMFIGWLLAYSFFVAILMPMREKFGWPDWSFFFLCLPFTPFFLIVAKLCDNGMGDCGI